MEPTEIDQLRAGVMRLSRRLRNAAAGAGTMSATGLAVLGRLRREGPLSMQSLADGEHVRPPSMSRLVDRLCELGYVARSAHPTDRRSVLVTLTDAGLDFLKDNQRQRSSWLAEQVARLEPEDAEALRRAIPALMQLGEHS